MPGYRDTAGDMYKAAILGLDGTKAMNGDPETLAAIDAAHQGQFNMDGSAPAMASGLQSLVMDDDAQRVWDTMASMGGNAGVSRGTPGSPPVMFYNEGPAEWMGYPGFNPQPKGWGPTGWNQPLAELGEPEPPAPATGYGSPGTVVSGNGEIATIPGSQPNPPRTPPPARDSDTASPQPPGPNVPEGGDPRPPRTGNGEITTIPGSNPTLPPPITPPPAGVNIGGPAFTGVGATGPYSAPPPITPPPAGVNIGGPDFTGVGATGGLPALPPPADSSYAQTAQTGLAGLGGSQMTASALDTSSAPSIQRESSGLQGLMDSPYSAPLAQTEKSGLAGRRAPSNARGPQTYKSGLAGLMGIG